MKKFICIGLILPFSLALLCQNIEKKIDQIFHEWNQGSHPGGVISILEKGEEVYSKAFGKASAKYNVANTEESIFNIGSVSKQFTAMGIIKLHLDGKLSVDDDIRTYLPELHDFDRQITIRHLLHHTSGLRSSPELFGLAGWREGDAITTDDDFRYLCRQTSLNFEPGSQFMYTNSGYILLAKVIERVAEQEFNSWMKENVFTPLEMNNTFVDENNSNNHPKVATPYHEVGPAQFIVGENSSMDIGASNIYTTASDLSKWMKNFHIPRKGWEGAFEMLLTTDVLSNGEANDYAFGVILDDFFGNKRIQHTGGVPGFLSYAMYYPEEEVTLVLLTNFTSRSVEEKFVMLAQLFLKNRTPRKKKPASLKAITLDIESAKKIVGDYWNVEANYPRKIYLDQDTLWYLRDTGMKSPLIQTGKMQFVMGGIQAVVKVEFELGAKRKMRVYDVDNVVQHFEEFDSSPSTAKELKEYVGKFYSQELETTYWVSMVNDQLKGYHSKHGDFPIALLKEDITDWSGFAIAKYIRNEKKEVIGFLVSINRVKNVWFEKRVE